MAGKGDTPRPVAGEKFRANYDTIFSKGRPYPAWICLPCGEAHGRGMPDHHVATWHMGACGICGDSTFVTEPRDFRHLKAWPL
jgi:hypothetical protein